MKNREFIHKLQFDGKVVAEIDGNELWNSCMYFSWLNGEPGGVFMDIINRMNPCSGYETIESTNPCIAKGTFIATADGRGAVRIEELLEEYKSGKEILLYSFDKSKNRFKVSKASKVILTKKNSKTIRIDFDDESNLNVTPGHKLMTVSGGYKEAYRLSIGESVQAFSRIFINGRTKYKKIQIRHSKGFASFEHHIIGEYLSGIPLENFGGRSKDSIIVHHKNGNHLDNDPTNLKVCSYSDHNSNHMMGDNNPSRRYPEKNIFNNPDFQKTIRETYHIGAKRKESTKILVSQSSTSHIKKMCTEIHDTILKYGLEVNEHSWESCKKEYPPSYPKFTTYQKHFITNHKVVGIEPSMSYDVYDIIVPELNNFVVITKIEDRINRSKNLNTYWNGVVVHNCGEQPLAPNSSCVLGSINLSKFVKGKVEFLNQPYDNTFKVINVIDWKHLKEVVRTAVRFLDNVIDANNYPIPEIEIETKKFRKIGLGVMGWADMLIKLQISYNSSEALELAEKVMKFINDEATKYSEELAEEKGFGTWEGYTDETIPVDEIKNNPLFRRRNATLTTIAPTGTLSLIANCSSGIEPVFSFEFTKKCIDKEIVVKHPLWEEYLNEKE